LKEGSVLTDEKKREREKRGSESEQEAPIIEKAAYKLKRGWPAETGSVGVRFHD
jgi:hypothetical protein